MVPKPLAPRAFCLVCGLEEGEVEKLHYFPSVMSRSQAWQEKMGLRFVGDTLRNYRICNLHFTNESYLNIATRKLSRYAVPTLLPATIICNREASTSVLREETVMHTEEATAHTEDSVVLREETVTHTEEATAHTEDTVASTSGTSKFPTERKTISIESYSRASKKRLSVFRKIKIDERTPRTKRLMNLIKSKESHIRQLKRICKNRRNDIRALSNIADSQVVRNVFSGLSRTTRDFLIAQLRCGPRKPRGRRWTTEEKAFALALLKRSSSGYNFLKKFVALPSKKTLLSLLEKVPFEAGINHHMFKQVKQCISTEEDTFVALLFDEVDIKQHLYYNKKCDRILGYEDFGTNIEASAKIATKALVFMVCGLGNRKWKQPVAYYLSSGGCSAAEIQRAIMEVLLACQNLANLKVVTTVCDMGTPNVKAVSNLGATTENPFFYVQDNKIFVLLDPPHLLKRTAELFRKYNVSVPVEIAGEEIRMEARFQDVRDAYQKDCSSPLVFRSLHKIRMEHLAPKVKYTMKVNIASQLMSHSVAAYIYTLTAQGELDQRAVASATFIQQVNDIFDSCNGSRVTQSSDGGNILRCRATSTSGHTEFWNSAVKQVRNWQFQRRTKRGMLKSMPPSQKGWITSLNALRAIWEFLQNKGFESLRPRSLNQDPLENLFGCIRGGCGRADNPTVVQFIGSLKTQIINGLSCSHIGGNCEEDEASLLTNLHTFLTYRLENKESVSVSHSVDQVVNESRESSSLHEEITEAVLAGQSSSLSVAYVSGFIVKHVFEATQHCMTCKQYLTGLPEEPHNKFIEFKEWSTTAYHLVYPSVELVAAIGHSVTVIETNLNNFPQLKNLANYLILRVSEEISFDFFQCLLHKDNIIREIIKAVVYISIPWWCKRKNRDMKDVSIQKKKIQKFQHL